MGEQKEVSPPEACGAPVVAITMRCRGKEQTTDIPLKYGKPRTRWRLDQMPKQLSGSTRHSDISVESTNSVDYRRGREYGSQSSASPDLEEQKRHVSTKLDEYARGAESACARAMAEAERLLREISVVAPWTHCSLNPLRDRLVDPDVSAASPSHRRNRPMLFMSCLVGVILAGGASAVIAFRQFSLADIWRDHVSSWAQLHRPTLTMGGEQAQEAVGPQRRPARSRGKS